MTACPSFLSFLWPCVVFAAALGGFTSLALAMDRHHEDVFGRGRTPGRWRRGLQLAGSALLLLSLAVSLALQGASLGWVLWLGALTAAALAVAGLLGGWPTRAHWVGSAAALLALGASGVGLLSIQ